MLLLCATLLAGAAAFGVRAPLRRSTALKAVWSDSRAVMDYQNLLDGKTAPRKTDGPAVVIGDDAMARAWAELAPGTPDAVIAVSAAGTVPLTLGDDEFPIYVFCAASELESILEAVPAEKKDDLVFMHYRGEMTEPILRRYGCYRDTQTNAVLYIAVNEYGRLEDERTLLGDDAMGEPKYAAESSATGKWAGAVADRLERNEFFCAELFQRDFRRQMFERVAFECVYALVGAVHKNVPISEVSQYFGEEVEDMMYELQRALRGHLALTLLSGVEERMAAFAGKQFRSKRDNRPAQLIKGDAYRNAFFYDISKGALEKGFPDPSPMHTEYFDLALEQNLFVAPAAP